MPYAVIPENAIAALPSLSGSAAKVMLAIASFMPGRGAGCYPSLAAIGERAGIKRKMTVIGAVKELTAAGILICERRRRQTNVLKWANLIVTETATSQFLEVTVSETIKPFEVAENATINPVLEVSVSDQFMVAETATGKETRKDTITTLPLNNEKPPRCSAQAEAKLSSPKPSLKPSKPKVTLGESGFTIPDSIRQGWSTAYPGVDIDREAAKAHAWCQNNPRRAPKSDAGRFLNSWLGRAEPSIGRTSSAESLDLGMVIYWRDVLHNQFGPEWGKRFEVRAKELQDIDRAKDEILAQAKQERQPCTTTA